MGEHWENTLSSGNRTQLSRLEALELQLRFQCLWQGLRSLHMGPYWKENAQRPYTLTVAESDLEAIECRYP